MLFLEKFLSRFFFLIFYYLGVPLRSGYTKRPPRRSILLSLTQRGNKVEIVATISSLYLILLSVAIEVFLSANVLHLANFISPNAVF